MTILKKIIRITSSYFIVAICLMILICDVVSTNNDAHVLRVLDSIRCNTIKFEDTITSPGCTNKTITNYRCGGQCYSAFLPSGSLTECKLCAPIKTRLLQLELKCGDENKTVKVTQVLQCQCDQRLKCTLDTPQKDGINNVDTKVRPCRNICRMCRKQKQLHKRVKKRRRLFESRLASLKEQPVVNKRLLKKVQKKYKIKKKQSGYLKDAYVRHCKQCHLCRSRGQKQLKSTRDLALYLRDIFN